MRHKSTPECDQSPEPVIIQPAALHDPDRVKTYSLEEMFLTRSRIIIGRGQRCDIWLRNEFVSAVHAQIKRDDAGHYLLWETLNTNGLFVNGARVPSPHPVVLEAYSTIQFGAEAVLTVCDELELARIAATTEPEFHQEAAVVYGTNALAGKKIHRGRETVRRKIAECNEEENP